jgi:hypothetical protein
MFWLLIASLAHAEPAALISRFPPGHLPDTDAVFGALKELAEFGTADDAPLLRSVVEKEDGGVQRAAVQALAAIEVRERSALRDGFSRKIPGEKEIDSWIAARAKAPSARLGHAEQQMVAYSALVLAEAIVQGTPEALEPVAQAALPQLREQAKAAERTNKPALAVSLYVLAMVSGDEQARGDLVEFGVDPDRLVLGMTSAGTPPGVPRIEAESVGAVVRSGEAETLTALLERARGSARIQRVMALDNLAGLLKSGTVIGEAARQANSALELSAADPQAEIRRAARRSLQDLHGVALQLSSTDGTGTTSPPLD